jgi:hypothetical protein
MDLTKRRNMVVLITVAPILLAVAAVLAAEGLLLPVEVTMVASGLSAAWAANPGPGRRAPKNPLGAKFVEHTFHALR